MPSKPKTTPGKNAAARRTKSSASKGPRVSRRSPTKPSTANRAAQFPIIGVGASAGGLEAFSQLLKHLPTDTGMGFVLVQHLDPDHESALTQILTRATSLPVSEVTDNLRVEPNHVYVIPPDKNMAIKEGVLKLQSRPAGRAPFRSIDFFFESLAHDQRECAIGVILSGTATDGTLGLEAIKGEGGIAFAQDESAKYDSMPRSAVAAGCVDFVLSPQKIAEELARIAKHPLLKSPADAEAPLLRTEVERETDQRGGPEAPLVSGGHGTPRTGSKTAKAEAAAVERTETKRSPAHDEPFKKILLLVRNHSGVDFALYKSSTIQRRITRRMVLNKHEKLEAYADFLKGNAKELDALYSDMLIAVTSFFRNPEAFDVLRQNVFPKLLARRGDHPVRVWTLGCSTGQEAYSLAMTFVEAAERVPRARRLQVFATDLNDALLEKARAGLYAKSLAQDVSPERLRRFFVEEEGGYRVSKELRQMVVFARQNLLSDPPFSHVDLISCRNLLIYLEQDFQKRIVPMFHYALNPDGYLFLGASESVAGFAPLFEPIDRKHKIFLRKAGRAAETRLPGGSFHHAEKRIVPPPRPPSPAPEGFRTELNAQREADRVTINQFAPPGVLINAELEILQFRGPTGAYLEPPSGKASFNVLKMAREGLMLPLRAAINKAKKEHEPVRKEEVQIDQDGRSRTINLEVIPLKNLREQCYLILFEEATAGRALRDAPSGERRVAPPKTQFPGPKRGEARRIAELDRELIETRDYLRSVQEQYEAANEELQAQSEEVQSANEELQSINEELETSKEELESANEELTTVNEEMSNRNAELNHLNADLKNLHLSINTAILVLGRDLTIRRFTPPAEKIFNLVASDVGRPISGIRHNLVEMRPADSAGRSDLALYSLEPLINEVIDTLSLREREVQDNQGRWYGLRVRPYMTLDNKIDGAVLILTDIDTLKRSERELQTQRDYVESILKQVPPLLVLGDDLRVLSANDAFYKHFRVSQAETQDRLIYHLGNGQWNIPRLRTLLEEILPRHSVFTDFEVTHDFPGLGRRTILVHARQLDALQRIVLRLDDVTERLHWQAELRRSELRYRRLFESAHDGILILDPLSRKITDANPFIGELLGYSRDELLGKELWQLGIVEDETASQAAFRQLQEKSSIRYEDLPLQSKDGRIIAVECVANVYHEGDQKVIQFNIRDITERKRAQKLMHASEVRFRRIFESSREGILIIDSVSLKVLEANPAIVALFNSTPEAVSGKELWQLGLLESEKASHSWFRQLQQEGRAAINGHAIKASNGKEYCVNLTASLYDEDGVPKIQCNTRDITEEKRLESELHRSYALLESRVQGQTQELRDKAQEIGQLSGRVIDTQEEEARRIALELHDSLGGALTALKMQISSLTARAFDGSKDALVNAVGSILAEMRLICSRLRPSAIDDFGITEGLKSYVADFKGRTGIDVRLTISGRIESHVDLRQQVALFRVVQESLTNIAKHSGAKEATVRLFEKGGQICLEIKDSGKGFEKQQGSNHISHGLSGMRERLTLLGGELKIESAPGQGTQVFASFPLKSPTKPA